MIKITLLTISMYGALLFFTDISQAQVIGDTLLNAAASDQPAMNRNTSKLSADLNELYDTYTNSAGKAALNDKTVLESNGLKKYIQINADMVLVDITLHGDSRTAREELEKIGVKVNAVFGRVISGTIPIKLLPQLKSAVSVKFARPAYKPMHQSKPVSELKSSHLQDDIVSPVISQGDTAQRSYIARKNYNVNGNGVKVGILSDSYNLLGTAEQGVVQGELPGPGNPFNFINPVHVLKDYSGDDANDEGRAMTEIVHDVAPGADLAFHTAYLGQADFAQGILDLAGAGCKVITDDVYYFAEPFFQDGIIAQAVDIVNDKGVTYVSAAGNLHRNSYESDYRATQAAILGADFGTAHNFSAPGSTPRYLQPITIPAFGTFIASFQWDQPFYSAGGLGAESDLNIILLDSRGNIIAGSVDDNLVSGDPLELFGYFNNTTSTLFYLIILKYSGPDPSRLKYILFRDGELIQANPAIPGIFAPTIVGHAKADGAITTAAAFYNETPDYDSDIPRVEAISSVGGVANYFDKEGKRIAPLIRKKPEITSVDGVNTSFFNPSGNGDIELDSDTFPNFFGTSAAAPHAAGVAALMIEAQKSGTITPDQIRGVLSSTTVDMDDIDTPGFDAGFDFKTGTGLIRADAAVQVVRFPNMYVKRPQLNSICSDDPATVRQWKLFNPNPFEVKMRWLLPGFPLQYGNLMAPPGEVNLTTNTVFLHRKPVPNIVIIEWEDNFGFSRFDVVSGTTTKCGESIVLSENNSIHNWVVESEINSKVNIAEVFPNPSSGNFKLYLSLADQRNTNIDLYSIDGRLLYKNVVRSNGIVNIDATGYKPGVYILKVKQGEFNKTLRLIRK